MDQKDNYSIKKAIKKFYQLISLERKEIGFVYFYAIISGFILLSLPLGIQAITNLLFGGTISTSLIVLIGVVVLGVLFTGMLQIAQMRVIERIQQRIFTRLTFSYAYRIPKISLISIDDDYLPELVNRFFDTANLQKGFSKLLLDFPAASIQILFGLILLCFYHPIFIVFALIVCSLVYMIFYFTSAKGFKTSMAESDYKYDVAHWLEEISRAIKTFKFHQYNELHLEKTDKLVTGYLSSRTSHFLVLILQYRVLTTFKVLVTAAMLIIGSYLFIQQQINLGQFIASEIIIITILNSVEKLIINLEVVYDVLTAIEKLNKVLEKPQDLSADLILNQDISKTPGVSIKVSDLSFSYPNKMPLIQKANFEIKAGEKVCITGSEGAGKSTLLKLLAGIYQDFSGNILINDLAIKMIPKNILYQNLATLFADDELFSGTLLENITIGNKNVNFTDLDLICKIVGLEEFITDQQKGYQLHLDPQGKKQSYNIVQKILLARCLVNKPSFLLIEDTWGGLESDTREQIISYLTNENQKFTLLVITNGEDFISKCDKKLSLENGIFTTSII